MNCLVWWRVGDHKQTSLKPLYSGSNNVVAISGALSTVVFWKDRCSASGNAHWPSKIRARMIVSLVVCRLVVGRWSPHRVVISTLPTDTGVTSNVRRWHWDLFYVISHSIPTHPARAVRTTQWPHHGRWTIAAARWRLASCVSLLDSWSSISSFGTQPS